jgi:2-oxoglutarate dehydrogenase E2 component (dihydrolipoamide succinyltransferase)
MSTEVRVPTLGESVTEATVATWFKKPGDAVAADEMLCELETDKVTVEVPAPVAGTMGEIVAGEGETVGVDALLATISEGGEASAEPSKSEPAKSEPAKSDAPAKGGGGGDTMPVMVPTLGESVTEATVSTWFKAEGDHVEADEMLCELETDKVSVEVPAPASGTLTKILAKEGDTVQAGGQLAEMGAGGGASAPTAKARPMTMPRRAMANNTRPRPPASDVEDAPAAKKAMAEKGLSRDQVQGSGRDGRIMKEDVAKAASGGGAPAQAAAPAPARTSAPRAGLRRRCRARGTGEDDPPAPDHRTPPERQPEYGGHAHHL